MSATSGGQQQAQQAAAQAEQQSQQVSAEKQLQLLRLGQHAIQQAEAAVQAQAQQEAAAGVESGAVPSSLQQVLRALACLKVEDAAALSAIMTHGVKQVIRTPTPVPQQPPSTREQQLAKSMAQELSGMSEQQRITFLKQFDQEQERINKQQQPSAAAAGQPAVKQEHKEQREEQTGASLFHLASSTLPSTAASAPSSSLFAASALPAMLDPASQLGLATYFKLLDIDKATKAPKLQSPQQFLQWRSIFAAFLQSHEALSVLESGSPYLSLPVDVATQASRTAALPLIEQGLEIGPPGHEQERKLDRQRFIFAHTALAYAVDGVPLALQAVTSVPMPNAQEAWKRLEAVMLPRTAGDRLLKEQEFLQLTQFNGESIASFAARAQQLVTQLANLGSAQQQEILMARFVNGIRSLEKSRRDLILASSITLQDAINKATNFETQERLERQLKSGGRGQHAESSSSAFSASFGKKGQQQSNMKCFNCGKKGHMAKDCRSAPKKKKGQQSGGGNGQSNNSSAAPDTCNWCLKKGHTEDQCRSKQAGKPKNMSGRASAAALEPNTSFMSVIGDSHVAELVQSEEPHSAHAAAQPSTALQDVLLDTGATHNMMKSDVPLQSSRPLVGTAIRTAGKQVLSNPSVGQLQLYSASASSPLQLDNVLSHPLLSRSLLSISSLVDRPDVEKCVFGKQGAQLIGINGDVMLTGSRKGGLYILDAASAASHAATVEEQHKLHARLGHMGRTMLSKLLKSDAVSGLGRFVLRQSIDCESCKEAKAVTLPFMARIPDVYRATRSLQRMHADLHGPIQQPSLSGARFSLVMIDEYSDFGFVGPIKSKDEAAIQIKKIVKQLHTQYGVFPAEIHTDRGGEFLSHDLLAFYDECGIKATQSPPHSPPNNGMAERFNRTAITAARSMLLAAHAPKQLWGEAIVAAVVLHNRLKVHDDGSTPLQRLTGKHITTDIHTLHPFGCTAFVAVPTDVNKQKYDPTGIKMVFVGWEEPTGYRLLGMSNSNKVIISRNVKFVDDDFSAMRSWSESEAAAEQGEESEDWLDEAIWRNEQRLGIEESKRQYDEEQERKEAVQEEAQQQQIVAPRPLRPSQRQQALPMREFSPSFSPSLSEASGSEYSPSEASPGLSDSSRGRGRAPRSAKPKPPKGAPPQRSSSRSTRGRPPPRLGLVAPGDIGVYPATILPDDLTSQQLNQVEQLMEDLIFGAQADVIPRGSSPYQEAQRQAAIDAERNNQPFPLDRPHCNKHGEITISQRCVGIKRNGEQCGARTKHGSMCWNHLQKEANLRIKKSVLIPAAGKGLMAAGKDFKTGDRVTQYTGDLSTDPDVDHGSSKYVVSLTRSGDITLDAARSNTAPGRMINDPKGSGHRPNTTFVIDNRRHKVRIQTTRPVHDKEEFLLPYGRKYWSRLNEIKAEQAAKKKAKRKAKRASRKAVASAASVQQLFADRDPITHAQAMASADAERWKEAERAEQKSLEEMQVYRFVTHVPADAKLLDSKPVYKRKRDNNGVVVRFKNRLVARGFLQRAAIDFDSTFAPTLSYSTIRVMLAIAAVHDLELKTMDVETAFLHAPLDRPLFMKIPASFTNVPANAVALELKKSLYGLHQSGKLWNEMLSNALIELGFEPGKNGDMCTFTQRSRSGRIIILGVFVDDIIYSYSKTDEPQMEEIKDKLKSKFKIKDLGDATSILGMRIKRDRAARTLELDQEQYIKQCCALLGLTNSKPLPTPENIAASRRSLSQPAVSNSSSDNDSDSSDGADFSSSNSKLATSNYRSAVGMLGYAALASRPDVAHAYTMAARQQQNPTREDIIALKHTFRYLLGDATRSLRFSNDSTGTQLVAFSDADWAGDSADARSTSGILLKLGGAGVLWSSSKQSNVALSSSEAEYIAASETGREIVAMRILLAELREAQDSPTPLCIDNDTAIRMALEEGNHGRRKHINVKHHYLRELVNDQLVVLEWVPTSEQQADILTKATSRSQFFAMRDLVMGHSLTPHAQFTEQLTFAQASSACTKLS